MDGPNPCACAHACPSVCLSVCPSVCLPACPSIRPSARPPTRPAFHHRRRSLRALKTRSACPPVHHPPLPGRLPAQRVHALPAPPTQRTAGPATGPRACLSVRQTVCCLSTSCRTSRRDSWDSRSGSGFARESSPSRWMLASSSRRLGVWSSCVSGTAAKQCKVV
jgi:hypothetical protein